MFEIDTIHPGHDPSQNVMVQHREDSSEIIIICQDCNLSEVVRVYQDLSEGNPKKQNYHREFVRRGAFGRPKSSVGFKYKCFFVQVLGFRF